MIDIPGAKYRIGKIDEPIDNLEPGDTLTLTSNQDSKNPGHIPVVPTGIQSMLKLGVPY
ncbi:MAG: hypothetical protein CM1200mP38_4840 [Dehalococcoidia bacterium]|nr:MAG: hypothetical protein CM1200mP38_4840 [Dehalococcoidia bacterium]